MTQFATDAFDRRKLKGKLSRGKMWWNENSVRVAKGRAGGVGRGWGERIRFPEHPPQRANLIDRLALAGRTFSSERATCRDVKFIISSNAKTNDIPEQYCCSGREIDGDAELEGNYNLFSYSRGGVVRPPKSRNLIKNPLRKPYRSFPCKFPPGPPRAVSSS